jgi:hypothetical protein
MFLCLFQKKAFYKYTIKKKHISTTLLGNLKTKSIHLSIPQIRRIHKVSIEDVKIYKVQITVQSYVHGQSRVNMSGLIAAEKYF